MSKKYSDRRSRTAASIAIACLAFLSAASILSCARKTSTTAAQASGADQRAVAGAQRQASAAPAPAAAPSAAARGAAAPARAASKSAPPLAASLRAFGLGARQEPRMPEDFSLGPLQSLRPDEKQVQSALAAARAFLDGVEAGKVDASVFLPEARDALAALLAPAPMKEGTKIAAARIGAIGVEGGSASLRVRLPSPEGEPRIEGLLSLRERDGSWYVEALALDPPSSGALAFAPGARSSP